MKNAYWKTTIVVWTRDDSQHWGLADFAYEADQGAAICGKMQTELVQPTDLDNDPDWYEDTAEFFQIDEEDEDV